MSEKMEPRYDQKEVESRVYEAWENSGYFNPDKLIKDQITPAGAEVFSIALPPPNRTGILHIGHAVMLAVEDILIRFHRMRGHLTLWVPGTDHAAIATQSKVESEIYKKEKLTRYDLGKEKLLERVKQFAEESRDTIVKQIKKMGASVDWSREAYTLDEERNEAVNEAFKRMHEAGLIYRGYRVVNWDPKGQTVISDDEMVHEERKAKLYTFKYDKDFPISISTTRPETKFGDTAVAVHPDHEKYKKFVGKTFKANFCGEELNIKVIADPSVDKDFGTGALGVTPAHSMTDWEIAQRHGLELKPVINEYAKMMVGIEGISGKKTTEAREAVVKWLNEKNLLEDEKEITQNVAVAERTGGIIEPLPKLQWFIDVNKKFTLKNPKIQGLETGQQISLKELMRHVVETGQIKIIPERFEKIYYHWIDNLRDWCISRQIWFGHQIPVWYKKTESRIENLESSSEMHIGTAPDKDWVQDEDTLDTWFSSGLWTFSTLGWPKETPDLKTFHPTSLLETGYDILFFWVARMILMTGFLLENIPFKKVYLHGLVRDDKGRKMSKSLGNTIDPLEMAEKYGADATRMSLIIGAAPGNDVKLSEDKIRGYRNFTTKIWNVARFVLMNKPEGLPGQGEIGSLELPEDYQKRLEEFEAIKKEVTEHIENIELHLAGEKIYHYFWHTFADKVVEELKNALRDGNDEQKKQAFYVLEKVLVESLKILHPFMPFVTEELYGKFHPGKLIMVEKW